MIDQIVEEDNDEPKLSDKQDAEFQKILDEAVESCESTEACVQDRAESELWDQIWEHLNENETLSFRRD